MSDENETVPVGYVSFTAGDSRFIIDDRYEFSRLLTTFLSKTSIKAKDKNNDKYVTITKLLNIFHDLYDTRYLLKSLKLQRFLKHENILSIQSILLPISRSSFNNIYTVQDFMESNLYSIIQSKQQLTEEHIQYFMYQILLALQYIHSANIVHYGLKPKCILINSDCSIKISEFDYARRTYQDVRDESEWVFNRWYTAPEVMDSYSQVGAESDIWSAGCILAELIERLPLFPANNASECFRYFVEKLGTPTEEEMAYLKNQQIRNFITNLRYNPRVNWNLKYPKAGNECLDLLDKMLKFDPKNRLKAEECLKHLFFRNLYQSRDIMHSDDHFNWSFEDIPDNREVFERMIYEEALLYSS